MPFPINDDAKIAFFSENNYFQGIILFFSDDKCLDT